MGRNKIEIKPLENPSNIKSTFKQRIKGVVNKARELATLCGAQVALIIISKDDDYIGDFHNGTMNEILRRYMLHLRSQSRSVTRVGNDVRGGNQPLRNPPTTTNSYGYGNNSQQYMVNSDSTGNNQLHSGPITQHMANMSVVGNESQPHIPQHMADISTIPYNYQPHDGLMTPQLPNHVQNMYQQHGNYQNGFTNENQPYGYDSLMGSNENGFQPQMAPPPSIYIGAERRNEQQYEGADNRQPYGNFPITNLHATNIQTHGDLPMGHSSFHERGYQQHEALIMANPNPNVVFMDPINGQPYGNFPNENNNGQPCGNFPIANGNQLNNNSGYVPENEFVDNQHMRFREQDEYFHNNDHIVLEMNDHMNLVREGNGDGGMYDQHEMHPRIQTVQQSRLLSENNVRLEREIQEYHAYRNTQDQNHVNGMQEHQPQLVSEGINEGGTYHLEEEILSFDDIVPDDYFDEPVPDHEPMPHLEPMPTNDPMADREPMLEHEPMPNPESLPDHEPMVNHEAMPDQEGRRIQLREPSKSRYIPNLG